MAHDFRETSESDTRPLGLSDLAPTLIFYRKSILTTALTGNNLMTMVGADWPRHLQQRYRTLRGAHAVALYMSGQFSTSLTAAATLWTRDRSNERWILADVVLNALDCGLYVRLAIDSVKYEESEALIYTRSFGADAGDAWGERVTLRVLGDSLTVISREDFHESSDGP